MDTTDCTPVATPSLMCEVCLSVHHKYRCPACGVRTCSVACVKKHKAVSGCTGRRDRTAFVKRGDFSEKNMFSDIRFLEDTYRSIDRAQRHMSTFSRDTAQ